MGSIRSRYKTGHAVGQYRPLLAGIGLALSIGWSAAFAVEIAAPEDAANEPEGTISIDFQDGRMSLKAKQAPVVELMQRVGREAGFEVSAYGDFTQQRLSVSFTDLRLANALKRLLKDTSAIITYSPSREPGMQRSIAKIYLLGSGSSATGSEPIRLETLAPDLDNNLRSSEIDATDAQERIAAIDRVEGLGDEMTLENLVFSLQHDPDPGVRLKAITAIAGIGGSTAAEMLESGLGDTDPRVRKLVVQTLGGIEDERIPFWLGQVLMGDSDPEVRLVAVQSIARQQGETARIFLEAATGDSSSKVSETALELIR